MKKYNNKILIVTLVLLIIGFVLSKLFYTPNLDSNLRKKLIEIDSAKITKIEILPPHQTELTTLTLQEKNWTVQEGTKKANVDQKTIDELLKAIANVDIKNLVSRKREKWKSFEVTDSSAFKVSIYIGSKKAADLRIGKVGFNKGKRGDMHTYVRLADEDEVYSTNGFLNVHFNKKFNTWRSKVVLQLDKEEVQKIIFNYPDSGFAIARKGSLWYIGSTAIPRAKATAYLNNLEQRSLTNFDDTFTPPASPKPLVIRIQGKNNTLATLKAWSVDNKWTIHSSLQDNTYFDDPQGEVVKTLFVGKSLFDN